VLPVRGGEGGEPETGAGWRKIRREEMT
jgi:hypothetical protein